MAQMGSWESVRSNGLLSTTALLDRYGTDGPGRHAIEEQLRKKAVSIMNSRGETAWIRDQRPMSERKLASCLKDGITPAEWYRKLNERVFFWLIEDRLNTLMRAYGDSPHLVLEVNTARLLERHSDQVFLAPMNTGTTSPMAFPRGRDTFLPPCDYPFEENAKKKGGARKAIVELTVMHSVPDIADLTNRAVHAQIVDGRIAVIETLYER
jgi:hypothetical protein